MFQFAKSKAYGILIHGKPLNLSFKSFAHEKLVMVSKPTNVSISFYILESSEIASIITTWVLLPNVELNTDTLRIYLKDWWHNESDTTASIKIINEGKEKEVNQWLLKNIHSEVIKIQETAKPINNDRNIVQFTHSSFKHFQ